MVILSKLAKEWIQVEINHKVSKQASDCFWNLGNKMFHNLYQARGDSGKKIPQFSSLRNKLNKTVPRVNMDVGYTSKTTGEITVVEDVDTIPVSKFPTNEYKKIYEIASVDASSFFLN